jgi:hypothetical protein
MDLHDLLKDSFALLYLELCSGPVYWFLKEYHEQRSGMHDHEIYDTNINDSTEISRLDFAERIHLEATL